MLIQYGKKNVIDKLTECQDNKISFIYTPNYYEKPFTEEMRVWELNELQDSDLVIVDLRDIANNISAHCMLAAIQMMNKIRLKHIFVIGIGMSNTDNYWLNSCIFKQFIALDDAIEYITDKIIN